MMADYAGVQSGYL